MEPAVSSAQIFKFGLFEADVVRGTLTRNGARVKIQDQPFRVLVVLLERPAEIISREELRHRLWPDGTYVDFDGSLNVILKKLRAAIGDDPDNPRFIETVPRRGYRFIAPVSVVEKQPHSPPPATPLASTSEGAKPAAIQIQAGPAPTRKSTFTYVAWAVSLVALIATAWVLRGVHRNSSSQAGTTPTSIRKSLAVLGFHNLSGRSEDAWLATALAEMFSTELAAGERLRLVSGEDVANLRKSAPWSQTDTLDQGTTSRIGSALSSDLLVLGSYTTLARPKRGQVRLDVRLQDAKTGEILTEVAEIGSADDLFQIVSRAGSKVRDRLGVPHLEDFDQSGVLASIPRDREAAKFYSLGLAKLRQFDFLGAKDLLQESSLIEPKFCLAHVMLARAWAGLGYEQRRKAEAKKALDLSLDLPRAEQLLVQGDYYKSIGDNEKAASTYHALFELFPDNVEYGLQLASAQWLAGHGSEASATVARLRQLPTPASDDPNIDLQAARLTLVKADSLRLIHAALAKASSQGKNLVYAQARHDECITLVYGDHPHDADAPCQEAYDTFLAAGNRLAAADTLRLIADRQGAEGHFDQSLATYNRVLTMLASLGDHEKTGAVLNNMGSALMNHGKLEAAEPLFREARAHFEQAGDRANALVPVTNTADLLYLRGQLTAAEHAYERVLKMITGVDPADPRYVLYRLADLQFREGKLKEARQNVEKSMASVPSEAVEEMSNALLVSGELSEAEGDLPNARNAFNKSLQITQQLGDMTMAAEAQTDLAHLALSEGQPQFAESLARQAIAQFEKSNSEPDLLSAFTLLSHALLMQNRADESRKAVGRAIELSRTSSDPALKLPAVIQADRVEMAGSDQHAIKAARQELRSTIATAKKLGYYTIECEARLAQAEFDLRSDREAARNQLAQLAAEARSHSMELLARQAEQIAAPNVVALNKSGR